MKIGHSLALGRMVALLLLILVSVVTARAGYYVSGYEIEETFNGVTTRYTSHAASKTKTEGKLVFKVTPIFTWRYDDLPDGEYILPVEKISYGEVGSAGGYSNKANYAYPGQLGPTVAYGDGSPMNSIGVAGGESVTVGSGFNLRRVELDTGGKMVCRGRTVTLAAEGYAGYTTSCTVSYQCGYDIQVVKGPDYSKLPLPAPTVEMASPTLAGVATSKLTPAEAGKTSVTRLEASYSGTTTVKWPQIRNFAGYHIRRRGGPTGTPDYQSQLTAGALSFTDQYTTSHPSSDVPFEYSVGYTAWDKGTRTTFTVWSNWVKTDYKNTPTLNWTVLRPQVDQGRDVLGQHIELTDDDRLLVTPMGSGTFPLEVRVKANDTAFFTRLANLNVSAGAPIQLLGSTVHVPGNTSSDTKLPATGGVGSLTFSLAYGATDLPGFRVSPEGVLTGAPLYLEGTYILPIVVEDESGQRAEASFNIVIDRPDDTVTHVPELHAAYLWHEFMSIPDGVEELLPALSEEGGQQSAALMALASSAISGSMSAPGYERKYYALCNINQKYALDILNLLYEGHGGMVANSEVGKCAWMYASDDWSTPVRLGKESMGVKRLNGIIIEMDMPATAAGELLPDRVFVTSVDEATHVELQRKYGARYFNLDAYYLGEAERVRHLATIEEKCLASELYRVARQYYEVGAKKTDWWAQAVARGESTDQIRQLSDYQKGFKKTMVLDPGRIGGSMEKAIWSFVDRSAREAGGRAAVRLKNSYLSLHKFKNGDGWFYLCGLEQKMRIYGMGQAARVRTWVREMIRNGLFSDISYAEKRALYASYKKLKGNVSDAQLANQLVTVRPTKKLLQYVKNAPSAAMRQPVRSGILAFDLLATGYEIITAKDHVKAVVKNVGGWAGAAAAAGTAGVYFSWLEGAPGPGTVMHGGIMFLSGTFGYFLGRGTTGVIYEMIVQRHQGAIYWEDVLREISASG